MVANEFLSLYSQYKISSLVGVEDSIDKLNYTYTVIILAICDIIATIGAYFSFNSIVCYSPTVPNGQKYSDYVSNYCWIHGTIPLRHNESLPENTNKWMALEDDRKINYYQWVPFMLGLQCILFYLPRAIWQCLSFNRLGMNLTALVSHANEALHSTNKEEKFTCIKYVANSLSILLFSHRTNGRGFFSAIRNQLGRLLGVCCVGKQTGTWIVFFYFCTKLLFLTNCILQLYLLQQFLGFNKDGQTMWNFGMRILENLINRIDSQESLIFPRLSYCILSLRHLGKKDNSYLSICALPINMFNEKIYLFIYFWIYFVTIANACSLPLWLIRLSFRRYRVSTIMKYFKANPPSYAGQPNEDNEEDPTSGRLIKLKQLVKGTDLPKNSDVKEFVDEFLRLDGVFIVYILRINAGDVITGDIVRLLWYNWLKYKARDEMLKEIDQDEDIDDFRGKYWKRK